MKKLIILLALIPTLLFGQNNTWVRFQVQFDFYAPQESNFFMVNDSTGVQQFFYQPTNPYEVLDTVINMVSGDYTISLTDNYGDGWISQNPASFKMGNTCQGDIILWDPVLGSFFQRDTTVNILPCAPPTVGCLDPSGLNYDSSAYLPGPCTYPPCGGFLTDTVQQTCLPTGQTLVQFFWTTPGGANCNPVRFWYWNADGVGPFQYGLGPNQQDFSVYAGNGQMPPNWSVEHYGVVEFADSTFSDTMAYTPTPCIAGCTDPTQPTYNPWATFDDGSCSGTTCDTNLTHQITMEITFDNWPNETGWSMTSGGYGILQDEPSGTYNFNDIGQTYTYNFCVDKFAGFELIITDTYGDGMAGTTSGGTLDGMVVIYDCLGDTIWWMDNPGFGNTLYSGVQFGVPCVSIPPVYGCTDDDYQEYDSMATIDDGTCTNLHIYGCTDPLAFNYNSSATINDVEPDCGYILQIRDAGGDGWGNSYLGVYQNGINHGTFTMGPGNYSQSFPLTLDSDAPVHVYYFEVGGPQQPPQEVQFQTWHNSFTLMLSTPDSTILIEEGTNPFANNGQGALQSFQSPFWTTYSATPYCGDFCIETVYGCMDQLSFNYNDSANVDDGSCIPFVFGCTNTLAFNYDVNANTDDGSCVPISYGCLDTTADNYNALANTDDGSCYYIGCTDIVACNYDPTATVNNGCQYPPQYYDCNNVCVLDTDGDGICDELEIPGCTNPIALNYDVTATDDDGSCTLPIYGCTDPLAFNYNSSANTDNGSCVPVVNGCTDPLAFNYNPLANTDNGSCIAIVYGCTDPLAFNFNPLANTENNSCVPFILGCTDSTAINYNQLANTDDGTCIAELLGCTDPTALNYNQLANTDDGTCIPYIYGCTDSTAFNYDPLANTDDNTCIPYIYGCTDASMFNYDPLANADDNTCIPFIYGCTDGTMFNYNPLANTDNGSCEPFIYGCTDSTMFNYDPTVNTDNGSCITFIYGCTDNAALNFDPLANTLDNSCCYIGGCTDPLAVNYNPNACYDDNSCITPIVGCTDVAAYNYDPTANVSDSTACNYDAGCYGGPGIPYWLNDGCYAWVISVDDYCCTADWDASCVQMYNYCQDGWPTTIEDISSLGIVVYPNPTSDIINIETRLEIEVEVYDIMGKLLISKDSKRIDLSEYSNGIYNLILIYNNKRFNTKVIKQ